MPSATPRRDLSLAWSRCEACPHLHAAGAPCPGGYWLVLSICAHCSPKTGAYCKAHRA